MANEFSLTFEDENGPRRVAVDKARFRVGRGEDNDLRINDAGLSRSHALLELVAGRLYISDCGSSNGTSVNSLPVQDAVEVYDGDRITLGNACTLVVSTGAARAAENKAEQFAAPAPEAVGVDAAAAAQPETVAAKAPLLGAHVL